MLGEQELLEAEELQRLPRSMLQQTLMDMGHFPSEIELDKELRKIRSRTKGYKRALAEARARRVQEGADTGIGVDVHNEEGGKLRGMDVVELRVGMELASRGVTEKEFVKLVRNLSLAELSD